MHSRDTPTQIVLCRRRRACERHNIASCSVGLARVTAEQTNTVNSMPYPTQTQVPQLLWQGEADLTPTSISLVLRVSALARRMLPGPFEMPLFVSACDITLTLQLLFQQTVGVQSAEAGWRREVCKRRQQNS